MLFQCPHCGEAIDVYVDEGGGPDQSYVEDCSVCCRPIQFSVSYDPASGEWSVSAGREI